MIRAVLFDLDGTLADRDTAVRALINAQWCDFADELAHVPQASYVDRFLALDAHGYADKTAVYQHLAETFGLSGATATELIADFWTNYAAHARLFPEVLRVLHALRDRGLKLGLVTNGTVAVQESVIAKLAISYMLDAVMISEREGVRKPQPEIFARAVAAVSVTPAEAWFVGDHPTADIEGATAAGLTAVWRRSDCWRLPSGAYRAIDTLEGVLRMLDELHEPVA